MASTKHLKRVSWAPGLNLCQVRLFLSEDAPSQSALGSQDLLQAKPAWLLHSSGAVSDESVPPGFETPHRGHIQSSIPSIKWQSPLIQTLKPEWLVVAGEESQEVASQNRRQLTVLEAVYPRLSSIPSDPCVSPEVQLAQADYSEPPLIPIIAKEDEDASEQDMPAPVWSPKPSLPSVMPPIPTPPQTQPQLAAGVSTRPKPGTSAEPDVAAAALAAFTAIMRSNEEGSLIDRDLLIKILCDPTMLAKLASEQAAPKQAPLCAQPPPLCAQPPPTAATTNSLYPMPIPTPTPDPNSELLCLRSPPVLVPTVLPAKTPTKDLNYYKSLIQKHGGERQDPIAPSSLPLPDESTQDYRATPLGSIYGEQRPSEGRLLKSTKPCVYFNTPGGCRRGSSCLFLHDSSTAKNFSFQDSAATKRMAQQRGTKRIKFDR